MLCLFGVYLLRAQGQKPQQKKKTKVDLLHADVGRADKLARPNVQVLIGSVKLRHDSMYMYCDSALIYENTNSFEAFNNVRMEQGDTLFIYGDYLYYDGISQLAQLRENVKMINRNTTLLTDSLNYDRIYDLGYYFEGGTLMDEENVLTSVSGHSFPFIGQHRTVKQLSLFRQGTINTPFRINMILFIYYFRRAENSGHFRQSIIL